LKKSHHAKTLNGERFTAEVRCLSRAPVYPCLSNYYSSLRDQFETPMPLDLRAHYRGLARRVRTSIRHAARDYAARFGYPWLSDRPGTRVQSARNLLHEQVAGRDHDAIGVGKNPVSRSNAHSCNLKLDVSLTRTATLRAPRNGR